MSYPSFNSGDVLTATDMNAVGLWKVVPTGATNGVVTSDGGVTVNSGVASVTVNGAFSSNYDNYRIVYGGGTGSTNITLSLKLGASATGYYSIVNYASYAAATTPVTAGDNNATQWTYVGYAGTSFTQASFDLINPNKAQWTTLNNASWAGTTIAGTSSGTHQVATAYTDFTLGVNTGTLTGGTIRVYGYRN